jgi:hypothetical protein
MRVLSRRAPRLRATSVALLLVALVTGCATPPGYPELEQADATVERARRSPRVRALAAAELDRAEVALQDAREAARAGAPPDRVEHLVYIVNQRAALAEARAAQQVARSEIEMLDRALVQGRSERGRQRRASYPAREQQPRAPLQLQARAPLAEDRQAQMPLRVSQQAQAPLREARQVDAPPQDPQQAALSAEEAPEAPGAVEEARQVDAPPQEPQRGPPSGEEARQAAGDVEEAREVRGSVGAQDTAAAEPDAVAVDAEALPQEITLSLAQMSFAGAEPTSETGERLAAVAEQLLREPERSVSIEAEFNLPDPEARTTLEQRVEIVRAILLRRGIAPARVVVRASGDGPPEPRAKSPFAAAPY